MRLILAVLFVVSAFGQIPKAGPIAGGGGSGGNCALATSSSPGCVQPDNSTITISGGVISAAAASGVTTLTIANASSTGTTIHTLTKLTGAPSTAVIAATTDTGGVVGIVTAGAGTTGNATVQLDGSATCVFAGATTANHYVQISSGTPGNCADVGATYPTSGQVIGRVLSTNGSAGTYAIDIFPAEMQAGAGAAFSALTSGTNSGAAMVVGTGASLAVSGSGTIAATSVSGFTAGAGTLTGPATSGTAATLANTETLTNKTLDGVTPTTFGYLDATSSIQTQLNAKQASLTGTGIARNTGASSELSGDCTTSGSNAVTCLKTNGSSFGTAATANTGTSGATVPLLSTANTWGAAQALGSSTATTQAQNDNSTKLSTTAYTDLAVANAVAGVNPAVAVIVATTQASDTSSLTYNNGVSGVGATFTGTTNTALTFDGVTLTSLTQRVLVKNDTQSPSGAFNGIYTLTQLQTGLLPPILTRALDYDQPSDMNNTGAIPVQSGTVNGGQSYLLTSQIVTVGTTPLTFTIFTYSAATLVRSTSPPSGITGNQGNGAKLQLSTGSTTTNDCVKFDANGNTVDAGAACASGGISPVYDTATSGQTGNLAAVTMVTPGANHDYLFTWTVELSVAGTSCTGSTTVTLNAIFQSLNGSGSTTEVLGILTIANAGVGTVGFVAEGSDNIIAKSGTAVQFSTSGYTLGASCSGTNPTYIVYPTLVQLW